MTKSHLLAGLGATALAAGLGGSVAPALAAKKPPKPMPRHVVCSVRPAIGRAMGMAVRAPMAVPVPKGGLRPVALLGKALDMSPTRLVKEVRKGLTIAEIAAKEHMGRAAFDAKVRRLARRELRRQVARGHLTAAGATAAVTFLERLASRAWTASAAQAAGGLKTLPALVPPPPVRVRSQVVFGGPGAALALRACPPFAAPLAITPAEIAHALGISPGKLRRATAGGITVAAIAEAHGLDRAGFFARLKAVVEARLKADVSAGRIPAAAAKSYLSGLEKGWSVLWTQTATPAKVRIRSGKS